MKLGTNLAAGIANAFWTAIVGLAVVPFYLHSLGIESYGLIGFFTALQALFALLDMGLAPTMNREVARSSSDHERQQARDLLHTLALFYWGGAALIAIVTFIGAPFIGRHWLNSVRLPANSVTQAVTLMGLVVACRFPLGLYLGALMGAQRMVTASGIEMAMVTVANVGAVAILAFVSPTIQAFFMWQAVVAVLNVVTVQAAAWSALREKSARQPRFDPAGLRRIWRFSAGMGLSAVLGMIFTQSDKIILSKIVNLDELGRYALAGLAARSLYVFVIPAFAVTYPRLTALYAAGDTEQMKVIYKSGTRLLTAVVFPLAVFVSVFSTDIFAIWTGDANLARSLALTVGLLMIGTALNAAMHFPYALQLACGKSNLPAQINLVLLVAFAPLVVVLASRYGIVGAAAAWAILNGLYLGIGTWVTHRTLLRGEGLGWILGDVGLPLLVAVVVAGGGGYLAQSVDQGIYSRLAFGCLLVGASFLVVLALSPGLVRTARRFQARPV